MNNKILKWIVIIYVVATVMFAIILKIIYPGLTYPEWYNFLACFFGGAVGGIATLIAVVLSINETRKIQEKNNKPFLIFGELEKREGYKGGGYADEVKYSICQYNEYFGRNLNIWNIANVGLGVAKDVEVKVYIKKKISIPKDLMLKDLVSKKYCNFIQPGGDVKNFKIKIEDTYNYKFIDGLDLEKPIILKYRDIFDNEYTIKYHVDCMEVGNSNNDKSRYIYTKSVEIEEDI